MTSAILLRIFLCIAIVRTAPAGAAGPANRSSVGRACAAILERIAPTRAVLRVDGPLDTGHNVDSDRRFRISIATVVIGSRCYSLSAGETIPRVSSVEVRLYRDDGEVVDVELPASMRERLRQYLVSGPSEPVEDFDCGAFGLYMNGLHPQVKTLYHHAWAQRPLDDEDSLRSGNTIVIADDDDHPVHVAIYLDRGLYLSKFGGLGPLIVTDLDEMKIGFDGVRAQVLSHPEFK